MEAIYITGIIVGGIVIIVFMLRDRITGGQASGEVNHGETKIKGQTKFEAAPPKAETKSETNRHYSIDIGGKTIFGFDKIKISLPSVRFFRDNFGGKTDFEISSDSNTSDSSPQIESQEAEQKAQGCRTSRVQPAATVGEVSPARG